jgi:hypothetical protein
MGEIRVQREDIFPLSHREASLEEASVSGLRRGDQPSAYYVHRVCQGIRWAMSSNQNLVCDTGG